jgi:hypothetical protein
MKFQITSFLLAALVGASLAAPGSTSEKSVAGELQQAPPKAPAKPKSPPPPAKTPARPKGPPPAKTPARPKGPPPKIVVQSKHKKPANNIIRWDHKWTFGNGVAVNGESLLELHDNGKVRFKTHFHDSGLIDYSYSIACVVRDGEGHVFSLSRKGTMHGTTSFGGNRNDDHDETKNHPSVKQHWKALEKSEKMSCHVAMHGGMEFPAQRHLAISNSF